MLMLAIIISMLDPFNHYCCLICLCLLACCNLFLWVAGNFFLSWEVLDMKGICSLTAHWQRKDSVTSSGFLGLVLRIFLLSTLQLKSCVKSWFWRRQVYGIVQVKWMDWHLSGNIYKVIHEWWDPINLCIVVASERQQLSSWPEERSLPDCGESNDPKAYNPSVGSKSRDSVEPI